MPYYRGYGNQKFITRSNVITAKRALLGATSQLFNLYTRLAPATANLVTIGVMGPSLVSLARLTPGLMTKVGTSAVPGITAGTPSAAAETGTAENAAVAENRIALGIEDHLDEFAKANSAQSWKQFAAGDPLNWKSAFLEQMTNPNSKVLFNLKDVDVWGGVLRASSGRGGATDWELLQIQQNPQWWDRITWLKDGVEQTNPFK